MALQTGTKAPDARIAIRPKEWEFLHELRGADPAVLLFFPLAFSGVCTQEMCTMAEQNDRYANLGVKVFGISVDSPYVNAKFAQETGATFPILSDFNRDATRAYGVLRSDLGGLRDVSERAVFVIDRDGHIVWSWQGENPGVMPPFEEIEAAARRVAD